MMYKNKDTKVIGRLNVKRAKVYTHFCTHDENIGRLNCRNIVQRASGFAMNNIGLCVDKELQKIRNTDIREEININTEMDKADTKMEI